MGEEDEPDDDHDHPASADADRALLGGSSDDDDAMEASSSEDEDGDAANAGIAAAVLGRRGRRAVATEAADEAAANLAGASDLTAADLVAGLGADRAKLGAARRALDRVGGGNVAPAPAPAPRAVADRAGPQSRL